MSPEEYENLRIKPPFEPCAKEAVHIDSPAQCYDCKSQNHIDYDKLRFNELTKLRIDHG